MKTMLPVLAVFLLTGGIAKAGDDSYAIAVYSALTTETVIVFGPVESCNDPMLVELRKAIGPTIAPSLKEIGYACTSRAQIARLNPPICTIVSGDTPSDTSPVWIYTCYRGVVDQLVARPPPPPTAAALEQQRKAEEAAQAAQRQATGYASYICHVIQGCEQIVPTTIYPTIAICQSATMSDPNFVPGNSTVWHECRTVQAQFASSSQEKLPQPVQSQVIPSPPKSALTVHPTTDSLPLPSVPSKSQPQLTPQSSPPAAPAGAADDDLAPMKAINPDAAARIQSYCRKIPTGGSNSNVTLKACEQGEVDAWQRIVLQREFPEDDPTADRQCREPPFPADSFVAYETCMKYKRNSQ